MHAQVGCTCLGVNDALLRGRRFDVCIVDEAGQITLPAVLGALQLARAFCLVRAPPSYFGSC
jgi:DNA replication ATP-dependent helicase Dna2